MALSMRARVNRTPAYAAKDSIAKHPNLGVLVDMNFGQNIRHNE